MSKLLRVMMAMGLIAVMLMASNVAFVSAATPPEPIYGTAIVNGDYGEWLSDPLFANMYEAGNPTKDVMSKLYLRYDCSNHTLYALVLAQSPFLLDGDTNLDNHFIKLGQSTKLVDGNAGNNGTPPDFAFIGLSGNIAQGWEASTVLDPGSYDNLNVHTQIDNERTSKVQDEAIPLEINCPGLGSIGDYVWNDVDRDGIQDGGESGINGVVVQLYKGGSLVKTTTTGNAPVTGKPGWYIFTGLSAGDYIVKVADSNFESSAVLDSYFVAVPNAGFDDTVDSDGHPTTHEAAVTLASGEQNVTIDFGFADCELGDRVWNDEDKSGTQANAFPGYKEPGFNGVAVYLYNFNPGTSCGQSGYLYTTTTISGTSRIPDDYPDGIYGFDMSSLALVEYWVCVDESTLPNPGLNMIWECTTANNPHLVDYGGGDDFSIDFGYVATSKPTAVTLSSFAAKSSAGGSTNWLWLGLAGLTVLVAGSMFWAKRRAG